MKIHNLLLGLIVGLALFATACPKRESIGNIESDPSRFLNKEVAVAGTVTNSFGASIPGIVSGGVYKIEDQSGSIWVLTQRGIPLKNARIGVKGRIQNGLIFNGKNYGLGMIESDRRSK